MVGKAWGGSHPYLVIAFWTPPPFLIKVHAPMGRFPLKIEPTIEK